MLPLITHRGELELLRKLIEDETAAVLREWPRARVKPTIGTMIEVPRAALIAGQLAELADFFSFGTNDLTQTGYALSRDDAGKFLQDYVERGILTDDPFVSVDEEGIGELMRIGCEHGGDPKSVRFCARLGFDYVSCSPFRVPVARLAAAQAAAEQIASRRAKRV
jgi:pyruvate,orthophosphate dikinase